MGGRELAAGLIRRGAVNVRVVAAATGAVCAVNGVEKLVQEAEVGLAVKVAVGLVQYRALRVDDGQCHIKVKRGLAPGLTAVGVVAVEVDKVLLGAETLRDVGRVATVEQVQVGLPGVFAAGLEHAELVAGNFGRALGDAVGVADAGGGDLGVAAAGGEGRVKRDGLLDGDHGLRDYGLVGALHVNGRNGGLDKVDVRGDVRWQVILVRTKALRTRARLVDVVPSLEHALELAYGGAEVEPALGPGRGDGRLGDTDVHQPALHGDYAVIIRSEHGLNLLLCVVVTVVCGVRVGTGGC